MTYVREKMCILTWYVYKFIMVICKRIFEWLIKSTSYGFVIYVDDKPVTLGEVLKETNEAIDDANESIEMYKD